MELDPKDQDIVRLLAKLKNAGGEYPSGMLWSRRQRYLRQVAEVGFGIGISGAIPKRITRHGKKISSGPPTMGTLLEATLVAAIIAEAGTMAYLYRDKIASAIQSAIASPQARETSSPNYNVSPPPQIQLTPTVYNTGTLTSNPTDMPTGTSTPLLLNTSVAGNDQLTPVPDPNGNNGNHYGQTPKPERTKKPDNGPKPTKKPNDNKDPKPTKSP